MSMILSGAFGAAFFYFLFSTKFSWPLLAYFAVVIVVVHSLSKGKHFKTAELNLFFLYAISLLLWFKGYPHDLIANLTYILGGAAVLFTLSDVFLKLVMKWSAWILVGVSITLIMQTRFNSWPLSIVVGAVVLPIALRDKEHRESDKNRA